MDKKNSKIMIDGTDYEFTVHFRVNEHDNVIHAVTKMPCLAVLEACLNTMKRAYPDVEKIEVVRFTFNHKDYYEQEKTPQK